ncbi:hypothetical protein PHOSAC3_150379 [Mesotoga infera]|nr:hypothetical protein PHOSAC3_150379 [Mesotoga infera]
MVGGSGVKNAIGFDDYAVFEKPWSVVAARGLERTKDQFQVVSCMCK